jgi:SAM domain (Sterile alpha motif)
MFPVDEILSNEYQFSKKMSENILNWNVEKIVKFFEEKVNAKEVINALREEKIDGKTLLLLNERDLYALEHKYSIKLGDLKKLVLIIHKLQSENRNCLVYLGLIEQQSNLINTLVLNQSQYHHTGSYHHPSHSNIFSSSDRHQDIERISPANSVDGGSNSAAQPAFATCKPEFFKTVVSLGELFNNN